MISKHAKEVKRLQRESDERSRSPTASSSIRGQVKDMWVKGSLTAEQASRLYVSAQASQAVDVGDVGRVGADASSRNKSRDLKRIFLKHVQKGTMIRWVKVPTWCTFFFPACGLAT